MEYLSRKLFGNTTEKQKRTVESMLVATLAYALFLLFLYVEREEQVSIAIAVYLLVLGWPALKATMKIAKFAEVFDYNIGIIIVLFVIWGLVGYFAGIGCLLLALLRFFQLQVMTEAQKREIDKEYVLQECEEQSQKSRISERFKSKKKVMEGENFYIGEGALLFDNAFIPLDAISKVELVQNKFRINLIWILIGVCGAALVIIGDNMERIYGCIMVILCIGKIYLAYDEHKKSRRLRIFTHSGSTKEMYHENTKFLESVVGVIKNAILDGDKSISYISLEQAVINTGETKIDMKNLNNSNIYTNSTVYHGDNSGNTYTGNTVNINAGQDTNEELTDSEWKELEDFFGKCVLLAEENDEHKDVYAKLGRHILERDVVSIKNYVRTIGTTTVSNALKDKREKSRILPLLNKILRSK